MRFAADIRYPASPDAVFDMLTDPSFRTAVCEATRALEHAVEVDRRGDDAVVRVVRVMPAQVPDLVRRFVGEQLEIVQRERWRAPAGDRRVADLTLEITGTPASMRGTVTLAPDGDGTRQTVEGDVRVAVPFVGGRVEPEIARAIRLALDKEAEVGHRRLTADTGAETGTDPAGPAQV